jgi:hypothetical protein
VRCKPSLEVLYLPASGRLKQEGKGIIIAIEQMNYDVERDKY